ncbi:hypothetical protein MNEG_8101 [Monoraphidium neglectum]|uniref:Uncharacterized protein n=1 Tax=Monoraphidium neglectum TaxID=145388 RepID=A0A0D2KX36_9CHLO|nr:hypothetical protein MNEG_8101 [Monoraphidium neglectum]KIY99858.1 hypothetical protein MNEG_8101 [Monoraphidium neglectum]|eukprot:XP_013898878.1 hypothetical protein MNEG_8101 [Monoraphidium neglectum]
MAARQLRQPAATMRRRTAVVHASVVWRQMVAYHLALELLAEAGFTVVATPYQLTFQHLDCARRVAADFRAAVQELRESGRGYLAPPGSAVVGVGHSNGALLHLLMGAVAPGHARANAVISFNNKQVSDAIPIPGLLDGLRPTVQAARSASPGPGPAPPPAASLLASAAAALPPGAALERRLVEAAVPALEQVGSVLSEVGDGVTEFIPTPAESRALIAGSYSVPRTLLVRFSDDSIDETPEMVGLLRAAAAGTRRGRGEGSGYLSDGPGSGSDWGGGDVGGGDSGDSGEGYEDGGEEGGPAGAGRGLLEVRELVLPGSHVTPCGTDVDWGLEPLRRAAAESQADVRRLVAEVAAWAGAAVEADRLQLRAAGNGGAAASAESPGRGSPADALLDEPSAAAVAAVGVEQQA